MPTHDDTRALAERVRAACVAAASDAYEEAGLRGLCAEGRWEYALDVVRQLDLRTAADLRRPADAEAAARARGGLTGAAPTGRRRR
jgi:hypothetical protein